ncbi:synaptotagmin-6-like, partial [Tachysurus ichikawai]
TQPFTNDSSLWQNNKEVNDLSFSLQFFLILAIYHNGDKKKKYDLTFKLTVVKFAEKNSGEAAATHFSVDPKRVRECRKNKAELQRLSDHLIHCFKEGEPCTSGRELLVQARQAELAEAGEGEVDESDEEEFANELVIEDRGDDDSDE